MGILFKSSGEKAIGGQALDVLSAAFIKPVSFAEALFTKKKVSDVVAAVNKQPTSTNIAATIATTAVAATALYGGAAVASGKGAALATSLIPKTVTGKIAAAVVVPAAAGIVVSQPKILEEIPKVPAQTYELTKGLASGNNVLQTIKENPYGAAALVAGAAVVAKGLAGTAATALNTQAVKENTQAASNNNLPLTTSSNDISNSPIQTNPLLPQLPATQALPSGKGAGGGKRKIKKVLPSMNQRVNILINNKNSNSRTSKRYLNREIILNA
jgi:hypothetical protein